MKINWKCCRFLNQWQLWLKNVTFPIDAAVKCKWIWKENGIAFKVDLLNYSCYRPTLIYNFGPLSFNWYDVEDPALAWHCCFCCFILVHLKCSKYFLINNEWGYAEYWIFNVSKIIYSLLWILITNVIIYYHLVPFIEILIFQVN